MRDAVVEVNQLNLCSNSFVSKNDLAAVEAVISRASFENFWSEYTSFHLLRVHICPARLLFWL
jgi:hypothetical protein